MMILVTYDVSTQDGAGKRRLRQVAKKCTAYGQRVQNSVFECVVDAAQYKRLVADLSAIIDMQQDSLRFYELGNKYHEKVNHVGAKSSYDAQDILMV